MKIGILTYRKYWSEYGDFDVRYRAVLVLRNTKSYWHIWSWREPFTRFISKKAAYENITLNDK